MNEGEDCVIFIDKDGTKKQLTQDMLLNFDLSEDELESEDLDILDDGSPESVDEICNQIFESVEDVVDPVELEFHNDGQDNVNDVSPVMVVSPEPGASLEPVPAPTAVEKKI